MRRDWFLIIFLVGVIIYYIYRYIELEIQEFKYKKDNKKAPKTASVVVQELNKLNPLEYKVINDVNITSGDKVTHVDHLIISKYGIFVIEDKNFNGSVYGSKNIKYWTQYKGKNSEEFINPYSQNQGNIKRISKTLNLNQEVFKNIVCFSNPKCELKLDFDENNIVNVNNLINQIKNSKDQVYNYNVNELYNNIIGQK